MVVVSYVGPIPNITGTFKKDGNGIVASTAKGCFSISPSSGDSAGKDWTSGSQGVSFSASGSSSIFGRSNTVQPSSLLLLPCIKC